MFDILKTRILEVLSHRGFQRYAKNTAWLFAEQILRIIVGFFVGVWVARYLGPEKYGIFSYALAFVAIFQGVAKLGLDGIVVREIVREPEKAHIYLGTSFWLKFVAGIFTFFLILVISWLTADTFQTFLFINIIAAGIIFQSFEVIDFYYQATVQAKYISIRRIVQLILSSLIKVYLIIIEADLIWFVLVTLFDAVSLAIFSWLIYSSQKLPKFFRFFDKEKSLKILKDGFPVLLSSVILMIQARSDQVLINMLLNSEQLGYYSSAMRIVEVFGFIPIVLSQSLYPAIERGKSISDEHFADRITKLYSLMWIIFFITAFPLFFFGEYLVNLLYGEAYKPAGLVLQLMSFRLLFAYFGVIRGLYLLSNNFLSWGTLTMGAGALLNVVGNILLIPIWGLYGAIISFYISFFITTFFIDLFNRITRRNLKFIFWGLYRWE